MPGVPSGRNCDACRKLRKKCYTTYLKPPCARCHRLGIVCVGFGQQRFHFKDEGERLAVVIGRPTTINNDAKEFNKLLVVAAPSSGLTNSLTKLTSAFVSNLNSPLDINVQLQWNFGDWLADVPCRLGTNEALDSASEALVAAYTRYLAGDTVACPDVLIKHSKALGALRQCLNDPVKAYSSETLSSILMLIVVQTLAGLHHAFTSHSTGAAAIMKGRGYAGPNDEFEHKLLSALRTTMAIEALVNSQVTLPQKQWRDLLSRENDDSTPDGQILKCIMYLPDLMQRSRFALRSQSSPDSTLLELRKEAHTLHENHGFTIKSLKERLENMDSTIPAEHVHLKRCFHAHFLRSYALALAYGIVLNCMLATLQGTTSQLSQESSQWADETIKLAEIANQYRPLGASYMIICLIAAWAGAIDSKTQAIVEAWLLNYAKDLPRATEYTSSETARRCKRRFLLL